MTLRTATRACAAAVLAALLLASCSRGDGREMREPGPDQVQTIEVATTPPTTVPFFTASGPWPEDGEIDAAYTCAGAGTSPAVTATNVPPDVVSLGLVLVDSTSGNVAHWAVANLAPAEVLVPGGAVPDGAFVAINDFGTAGYEPPCAEAGTRHEYLLMVYSFDQVLELPEDATSDDLTAAFEAAALDVAMSAFTVTAP
jgi:phosphatidylethanolamine-binding protein (PEBP) family uncharacterized protein